MLPTLPQEIIDLIVDTLSTSQHSLQSCALVSRSFTLHARSHLFSNLTLRWKPKSKYERPSLHRTQLLKTFLETDPTFLRSIQHLDIGIPLPLHSNMLKEITGPKSGLSEILNLLYSTPSSRLHTLSLSGFTQSVFDSEAGLRDRTHFWHDIGFLPALYNLCLSGSIHTLRLGYLRQVPPEFFSKLHRNIKCISLIEISLSEAVYLYSLPLPPTGITERPVLEELHVQDEALYRISHGSSSDGDVPAYGPDISKLILLDCVVGVEPCWELPYWAVIQQASGTLRSLRLAVDQSFHLQGPDEFALLDLGLLPSLRTLSFQIKDNQPHYWTALEAIIHLLESPSSPTQIEYVTIDLVTQLSPVLVSTFTAGTTTITTAGVGGGGHAHTRYGYDLINNDPTKRASMHVLDDALTRGNKFPALVRFGMKVVSAALEGDAEENGALGLGFGAGAGVGGGGGGDHSMEDTVNGRPPVGATVVCIGERELGLRELLPRAYALGLVVL